MDGNVSKAELLAMMATHELETEKRLGKIERDVQEIKVLAVKRNGPIIDELRNFEQRVGTLEQQLQNVRDRSTNLLGKADITEIVRSVVAEGTTGDRSTRDYLMRVVMFAISLGTLIFASKGSL